MMAYNRVLIRVKAGMISAYASLEERARAVQLLNEADEHFPTTLVSGNCIHGVMPDDLYHAMAVAYLHMGNADGAAALLAKAVEKGCRDAEWMESDPELSVLLDSGQIRPLLKQIRQFAPLQFRAGLTQ